MALLRTVPAFLFAVALLILPGTAIAAAPTANTQAASDVEVSYATLNASVNPNGKATTYQFEYGTTASYGSKAPSSFSLVGSGSSPVALSSQLEGLKPETNYHFRVVAVNSDGASYGSDVEFTTLSAEADSEPLFTFYTENWEGTCPWVSLEPNEETEEIELTPGCVAEDFEGDFDLGVYNPNWTAIGNYGSTFDLVVDRNGDGYAINPTVDINGAGFPRDACDESDGTVLPWRVKSISPAKGWDPPMLEIKIGMRTAISGPGGSCSWGTVTVELSEVGMYTPTELQQVGASQYFKNAYWFAEGDYYGGNSLWMDWS